LAVVRVEYTPTTIPIFRQTGFYTICVEILPGTKFEDRKFAFKKAHF